MSNGNFLEDDYPEPKYQEKIAEEELEHKKLTRKHNEILQTYRDELFKLVKIAIPLMFIVGYSLLVCAFINPNPNSTAVAIAGVMVPLVMSLAMARFLYGNNSENDEKSVPSIALNIAKELRIMIMGYFKSKTT